MCSNIRPDWAKILKPILNYVDHVSFSVRADLLMTIVCTRSLVRDRGGPHTCRHDAAKPESRNPSQGVPNAPRMGRGRHRWIDEVFQAQARAGDARGADSPDGRGHAGLCEFKQLDAAACLQKQPATAWRRARRRWRFPGAPRATGSKRAGGTSGSKRAGGAAGSSGSKRASGAAGSSRAARISRAARNSRGTRPSRGTGSSRTPRNSRGTRPSRGNGPGRHARTGGPLHLGQDAPQRVRLASRRNRIDRDRG
jgi:hypothetical protein